MNKKILGILGALAIYAVMMITGASHGVTWDWYIIPNVITLAAIIMLANLKGG